MADHAYTHCRTGNLKGLRNASMENFDMGDLIDMFHIAVEQKHPRIMSYFFDEYQVETLIDRKDSNDFHPFTPLQKAIHGWKGDARSRDVVLLLLGHGAKVSRREIQLARDRGHHQLAHLLAEHVVVCKQLNGNDKTCQGHALSPQVHKHSQTKVNK